MINIISRAYVSHKTSGPKKVVENLVKGLDLIKYPYCLNKDLKATSQLWIHDDEVALKEASRLKIRAVVGPNIYIVPRNIPNNLDMSGFVYIHPSKWPVDFWTYSGFNRCKLDYWPTGIDTTTFTERTEPAHGTVIIYYKQRYRDELDYVKQLLKEKQIPYDLVIYGAYNEKTYMQLLNKAKYVIWLGRQESQGIALEEALSMNVPILVWDVSKIGHWIPNDKEKNIFTENESEYTNTTSAYYFDSNCGIKIRNKVDLGDSIDKMESSWRNFKPRKYIIENLNLRKQALDFIQLFSKHFEISYADGYNETVKSDIRWRNDRLAFKTYTVIKELIKKCLNY